MAYFCYTRLDIAFYSGCISFYGIKITIRTLADTKRNMDINKYFVVTTKFCPSILNFNFLNFPPSEAIRIC